METAPICQQCRELNLPELLHKNASDKEEKPLGPLSDIIRRRDQCGFCFLASEVVRLQYSTGILPVNHEAGSIQCFCKVWKPGRLLSIGTKPSIEDLDDKYKWDGENAVRCMYSKDLRSVCDNETPEHDQIFRYRPTKSTLANFDLLRRWRSICESVHKDKCANPQWLKLTPPTSLIVIDVNSNEIVTAPPNSRYAALSYIWGSEHSRNSISTLSDLDCLPRPLQASLPKTISDAIRITKELQLDYLWVDALCIAQLPMENDNKSHHLNQMDSVFHYAELVIVAADSTSAESGIFTDIEARKDIIWQHDGMCLALDRPDFDPYIRTTRWSRRAWTFQEGMLARRLAVFGKYEVFWICQCDRWRESVVSEPIGDSVLTWDGTPGPLPDTSQPPQRVLNFERESLMGFEYQDHTLSAYIQLVSEYTLRRLSCPGDGLNAINGMLSILQGLDKGRLADLHYALPGRYFDFALLWDALMVGRRSSTLQWKQQLPSWSWTGWFSAETVMITWDPSLFDIIIMVLPAIDWYLIMSDGGSSPLIKHERIQSEWDTLEVRKPCGIDPLRLHESPPLRRDLHIEIPGYFLHFLTTSAKFTIGYSMPCYEYLNIKQCNPWGPYSLVDQEGGFAGSIVLTEMEGTRLMESAEPLDLIFLSYAQTAEAYVTGSFHSKEDREQTMPQVKTWDEENRSRYPVVNAMRILRMPNGVAERVQLAKVREQAWLASDPTTEWVILG